MRKVARALMAALTALAVVGCGSGDLNPDPVAEAATKTAGVGGMKLAFTADIEGRTVRGSGFMDVRGHRARMRFLLPQAGGDISVVMIDQTMYMRLPGKLRARLPGGKPWIRLEPGRIVRGRGGAVVGWVEPLGSNDPSQLLAVLRGADDVKRVGTETVRGVATTHYRATIDLRKAADKAPAAQRETARRRIEDAIKLIGESTMPTEAWIDDAGRLRRVKMPGASTDLYDFGTRETIVPPPASETADVPAPTARGPKL